ncbi:MAG: aminoacyl-tRNA hydrolase [Clostridiales bacterium]|jgi:PTH1 family peptidyl-tRNA hydrolase|nr:aminoacyl-tRNA hydrolase [Clostridiales bacterium]
MFLIAGLGNPEREYKGTRHNIGFEAVNKLAYDHDISLNKAKLRSHFGEGFIAAQKVILAKPQTYMNLSGEAVRDLLAYFKLTPEDLIVIYDDISLPLGDIRVRKQGSAGGHNGMKNILYHLETHVFTRVRIGIGANPGRVLKDYVLSRFGKSEMEAMVQGVTDAGGAVEMILRGSADAAMNQYNKTLKTQGGEAT